jgi:hypothetical protein
MEVGAAEGVTAALEAFNATRGARLSTTQPRDLPVVAVDAASPPGKGVADGRLRRPPGSVR